MEHEGGGITHVGFCCVEYRILMGPMEFHVTSAVLGSHTSNGWVKARGGLQRVYAQTLFAQPDPFTSDV